MKKETKMRWGMAGAVGAGSLAVFLAWGALQAQAGRPAVGPQGSQGWVRSIPSPALSVASAAGGLPLYVGTARGLYRSEDGAQWKRVFAPGLWGRAVRAVGSLRPLGNRLWLASESRLFFSSDGIHWQPGPNLPEAVSCVAADPLDSSRLLIGTQRGLYESRDAGASAHRLPIPGLEAAVHSLLFDPARAGLCFALSTQGLFRSEDGGRSWTRETGWMPPEADEEAAEEPSQEEEMPPTGSETPPGLAADPSAGLLYLSTAHGLFQSRDAGREWEPLPLNGFSGSWIAATPIVVDPKQPGSLLALAGSQVFSYRAGERRWIDIAGDLPGGPVYDVEWADGDSLWAATAAGLFRVRLAGRIPRPLPAVSGTKPSIDQVRRMTIAYAEVGPDKIRRWRSQSRLKSFVPSFTLGLNRDRDANIVSSTTSGSTKFTVGPEHQSLGVDFGFTWHLADLIWSSDQTAIDVRSRLTTQRRQDLVEEATRLYFEREKLLAEFESQPTEDGTLRRERSLRIAELAAYLDGLTGGGFSRQNR